MDSFPSYNYTVDNFLITCPCKYLWGLSLEAGLLSQACLHSDLCQSLSARPHLCWFKSLSYSTWLCLCCAYILHIHLSDYTNDTERQHVCFSFGEWNSSELLVCYLVVSTAEPKKFPGFDSTPWPNGGFEPISEPISLPMSNTQWVHEYSLLSLVLVDDFALYTFIWILPLLAPKNQDGCSQNADTVMVTVNVIY